MNNVNSTSNNGIKAMAVGVAIALHGLAGLGLAHMQMPELKPLKITPPIKIEIIEPIKEPEIVEIKINNLESPEPPKPIMAPKIEKKPDPRPAPAKPKIAELKPVKPQTVKPAQTPKVTEPEVKKPRVTQPSETKQTPKTPEVTKPPVDHSQLIAAQQRAQEQARWEAQQRAEADRLAREKAAAEARAKADADAKAKAEADAKAAAARREAEAAAAAAKNSTDAGSGKRKGGDGGEGHNSGDSIGPVSLSAAEVDASWRRKPNLAQLCSPRLTGKTVNVTVKLTINEKGSIQSASVTQSSGDKAFDRDVARAYKSGRLKPFIRNGQAVKGFANVPTAITIPSGAC
ncbi:hypothetical protein AAX06_06460 [Moraxella bovoculi]|uniref:TonB C-terminal domain-containing protein n=1 Tax=Moraxella bovoculi TaxID=386891 RepID=A0AAC8PVN8_9GAMM|nr:TonB family protein [Moraxella bovoculi]AKG07858.1 hypothetical protein AAX06_06460 [Moraxella bovoculi]AKG11421.1 hypothetical protein AAX07_04820 [Moraxella bovoculi]